MDCFSGHPCDLECSRYLMPAAHDRLQNFQLLSFKQIGRYIYIWVLVEGRANLVIRTFPLNHDEINLIIEMIWSIFENHYLATVCYKNARKKLKETAEKAISTGTAERRSCSLRTRELEKES
jgi:hypothetical protein